METKKGNIMMFHQDLKTWWEGERLPRQQLPLRNNYLNKADKISKTIFRKPFEKCYTYEKNYIIKMIVKGVF